VINLSLTDIAPTLVRLTGKVRQVPAVMTSRATTAGGSSVRNSQVINSLSIVIILSFF